MARQRPRVVIEALPPFLADPVYERKPVGDWPLDCGEPTFPLTYWGVAPLVYEWCEEHGVDVRYTGFSSIRWGHFQRPGEILTVDWHAVHRDHHFSMFGRVEEPTWRDVAPGGKYRF